MCSKSGENAAPTDDQADQLTKAHLAAIVESSDDAIISKSLDGIIISWNPAAERIFGYKPAEIIGRSILALIPPERRDEEKTILARLRAGERIDHFNTVRMTKDGRHLEVMISISPVRDSSGRVIGASKLLRMLSPEKQAEQAKLDSEARLRGVVDNAVDGIITISEMGLIESINLAGLGTFGYSQDELIGQNIKLLMPDPYFAEHDRYLFNYRSTGLRKIIGIGREVMGRRKDGSTFPVDLAVSEVQLGDRRIFTGIVRDITQRKEAEQALRQAKEVAEAASRAKEHFLSVLSHELRTPLTPVLAEMSFIEEQTDLSPDLRSRLAMVRRNIETEARLVDDLLDLTRISRGKVQLRFEVIDLHEIIRGAIGMFQSAMEAKSLEVSLVLQARQHHVWADPGRVQQILLNLLSNAVKFTPNDGRISVHSSNHLPDSIEIEVTDNGMGIDPETFSRLFGAFEQGDCSRRHGGLGLGLSIAKSLTELHSGTLTASSAGTQSGSTFRFTLAAVAPVESLAPAPTQAKQLKIGRRILLVEDHADTRIVMARLLRSLGCHVTTAGSVREALAAAETGSFDLLISDIGLPDGTGLEVMQQLKGRVDRAIALSGFGQEEDFRRSREAGFEMHLIKPINFNTLKDLLNP